ncbi:MAG: thioesterase [Coxiella sp. (in: Bacteria)]|nr:MAG: thioesterase [Coxiella sp. (in: g-proteobacteria)]
METQSLQDKYAAKSICYGCGPANEHGFQIKSFVDGEQVIAHYHPKPYHHAFPNVLNGGAIGTVLDCHCNWASCWYLMQAQKLEHPPCTVTAEYRIKLRRPAPVDCDYTLVAELISIEGNKATIHGELKANEKIYATCDGVFVAIPPEHPAYHRW